MRDVFLNHSRSVAQLALNLNARFRQPLPPEEVEAAAMLHDIGVCFTHAPSIHCHGEAFYLLHGCRGADLLRSEGVDERYARVCERHTGVGITAEELSKGNLGLPADRCYMPQSDLEKLICFADKFYSKSGSGKRKSIGKVEKSFERFGPDNVERFRQLHADIQSLARVPIDDLLD